MGRSTRAILEGGLVAGALDIVFAIVVYGPLTYKLSPERVLQSVASGWIGRDAAQAGGAATAALGLATHFMIAFIMAAAFVALAGMFKAMARRPILWGFLYGLVLYVVMYYVVTQLSAAHPSQHFAASLGEAMERLQIAFSKVRPGGGPWLVAGTIFTHTILVGVPIALAARPRS